MVSEIPGNDQLTLLLLGVKTTYGEESLLTSWPESEKGE
jgi:hypothetical protein